MSKKNISFNDQNDIIYARTQTANLNQLIETEESHRELLNKKNTKLQVVRASPI